MRERARDVEEHAASRCRRVNRLLMKEQIDMRSLKLMQGVHQMPQ